MLVLTEYSLHVTYEESGKVTKNRETLKKRTDKTSIYFHHQNSILHKLTKIISSCSTIFIKLQTTTKKTYSQEGIEIKKTDGSPKKK